MAGGRKGAWTLAVALVWGGAALAEEPAPSSDQATLDRFAKVHAAVTAIRQSATAEVGAQPEPDERSRLRREAQMRMRQAADAQGMTVADYNRLVALLREDPAFRAQVERSR